MAINGLNSTSDIMFHRSFIDVYSCVYGCQYKCTLCTYIGDVYDVLLAGDGCFCREWERNIDVVVDI